MKLKTKHEIFIEDYLVHGNATRAARLAGYRSPKQAGFRLLHEPEIAAEIEKRAEKHLSMQGVDRQWVVDGLVREVRQAQAANKSTNALRGLELLAKHLGMFTERTEISFEAEMLENLAERMAESQARMLEAKEPKSPPPESKPKDTVQ
jgi:phage terminase small subunit